MRIVIFLVIYLTICAIMGVLATDKLGQTFIPVYILAVVIGGIGAVYTLKHHMPEDELENHR